MKGVNRAILPEALFFLPAKPADKYVVLTIDDAPSSRTDEILALLKKHNAKATFFIHTDQISSASHETYMKQIAADGHDIAHHMPANRIGLSLSKQEFEDAFQRAHAKLTEYGSAHQKFFRPPQGYYNKRQMAEGTAQLGYDKSLAAIPGNPHYVMASFLPWDATALTNSSNTKRNHYFARLYATYLAKSVYPGAIVVFHDGEEGGKEQRLDSTLVSLDLFLQEMAELEIAVISLSEALDRLPSTEDS